MLDELRDRPRTTGEMTELFPEISRFAVMQHLRVLEQGNLIVRRKKGRQCFHYLNAVPIQQIYYRWVRNYQEHWAESLVSLKARMEETEEQAG